MQKQCEEKMGKKGTSSTSTGGTVFEGDMFVGCQNCDLAGEPNRTYNQSRWWYVVTHWIHNIVLYPDKHSWCTTTAIVQVVGHPGCNSVKIDNNVCVGACFSYIVPKTIPETPGDVLPYCDSCQPDHISWKKINLECTEGNYKNQNLTKYVQLIHDCTCGSCSEQLARPALINAQSLADLDQQNSDSDLVEESSTLDDTTDILRQPLSNSSSVRKGDLKSALSGLLKTLNNEDENILEDTATKGIHKNVWKQLLDKVEALNTTIDTSSLNQLIKSVEEESKVKFNYKRLKQALLKFKKYQVVTKAHTREDEIAESQRLPVLSTEASDQFGSGLYSKLLPKLPPTGIEETASPLVDVAPGHLKPATSGSEISYHDNIEANNSHRIIKKEKSDIPTNFTVPTNFTIPENFNSTG
ncbi:hypothetical protein V9T40_011388 [Parthenolecanium corni]|uniref:CTCK domain-containing protein n=1 Tax=Parthenolecanium corni TaxID=536013 RepID=A0AAN9XYD9_9HEMI